MKILYFFLNIIYKLFSLSLLFSLTFYFVTLNSKIIIPDPTHLLTLYNHLHNIINQENFGVSFIDITSNEFVDINAEKLFNPASVIKIPVMVEAFRQLEEGKISFTEEITLKNTDKIWGSGRLWYTYPGRKYSIETLVELMITESDNTATKILIDRLGRKNINNTIANLGLKNTYIGTAFLLDADNLNFSTPKDMAILLHKLYNLEVVNPSASQKMLAVLIRQKHRWGIPKFLPQTLIIANKTGALTGVRNDAGIIFYKDKPYILSIFSHNVSSNLQGNFIVRTISWEIYNWKENLYANSQLAMHEQNLTQKNNL